MQIETQTTQASRLLDDITQKAKDSLFFTATALLGYNRLTSHLHYEMARVAEEAEALKRVLILIPRDHYKTTVNTIAYAVWRGLRNPNETGLITMNNARNAERVVGQIRSHWMEKPLLRRAFWNLRPELSKRWNKEEACLPRDVSNPEATWTAAGWDTKVTSGHWDYLIFDDVCDEETYESVDLMAKLEARFEQREGLLRPPVHERTIVVVMNHWSPIDLACRIIERHPEYHIYYRQAIEDEKPIFPEAYTLDWLYRKQKQDPYTFANQWMNNPVDKSVTEMRMVWLHEYKRGDNEVILPTNDGQDSEHIPLGHMNIYATVDPRHSLSTTPGQKLTSRNAIVVAGIDWKGRRYLLDEYASRSDPVELVRQLLAVHKKWNPIKIGIEGYGFQQALAPLAREIWKDEPSKPRVEPLKRDTTRSKEVRCRGGLSFFRDGLGYIHKNHLCFKEEYITFPHGRTLDVLDAWAWCMELMHQPVSAADRVAERQHDRDVLRHLHPVVGI